MDGEARWVRPAFLSLVALFGLVLLTTGLIRGAMAGFHIAEPRYGIADTRVERIAEAINSSNIGLLQASEETGQLRPGFTEEVVADQRRAARRRALDLVKDESYNDAVRGALQFIIGGFIFLVGAGGAKRSARRAVALPLSEAVGPAKDEAAFAPPPSRGPTVATTSPVGRLQEAPPRPAAKPEPPKVDTPRPAPKAEPRPQVREPEPARPSGAVVVTPKLPEEKPESKRAARKAAASKPRAREKPAETPAAPPAPPRPAAPPPATATPAAPAPSRPTPAPSSAPPPPAPVARPAPPPPAPSVTRPSAPPPVWTPPASTPPTPTVPERPATPPLASPPRPRPASTAPASPPPPPFRPAPPAPKTDDEKTEP